MLAWRFHIWLNKFAAWYAMRKRSKSLHGAEQATTQRSASQTPPNGTRDCSSKGEIIWNQCQLADGLTLN
jgi:hypothetical protein